MEFASLKRDQVERFIRRHLGNRVARLLREAGRQHEIPRGIATSIALSRFQNIQHKAAHPTPLGQLFNVGLELYRRGWFPGSLVALLSLPYFGRSLA